MSNRHKCQVVLFPFKKKISAFILDIDIWSRMYIYSLRLVQVESLSIDNGFTMGVMYLMHKIMPM